MAKLEKIMQEDGPIVQPRLAQRTSPSWTTKVQGFEMHPTTYVFGWQRRRWRPEAIRQRGVAPCRRVKDRQRTHEFMIQVLAKRLLRGC